MNVESPLERGQLSRQSTLRPLSSTDTSLDSFYLLSSAIQSCINKNSAKANQSLGGLLKASLYSISVIETFLRSSKSFSSKPNSQLSSSCLSLVQSLSQEPHSYQDIKHRLQDVLMDLKNCITFLEKKDSRSCRLLCLVFYGLSLDLSRALSALKPLEQETSEINVHVAKLDSPESKLTPIDLIDDDIGINILSDDQLPLFLQVAGQLILSLRLTPHLSFQMEEIIDDLDIHLEKVKNQENGSLNDLLWVSFHHFSAS
jgi:hypothetical protein